MTAPTKEMERLARVADLCADGTWNVQSARREVYGVGNHSHSLPADLRAVLAYVGELEAERGRLLSPEALERGARAIAGARGWVGEAGRVSPVTQAERDAFAARAALAAMIGEP